jgi:hypothetical protein
MTAKLCRQWTHSASLLVSFSDKGRHEDGCCPLPAGLEGKIAEVILKLQAFTWRNH